MTVQFFTTAVGICGSIATPDVQSAVGVSGYELCADGIEPNNIDDVRVSGVTWVGESLSG